MTQDEIIRMAREAGLIQYVQVEKTCVSNALERFAALVAKHERNRLAWTQEHWTEYEHAIAAAECEACAKVCEPVEGSAYELGVYKTMQTLAAAIRARGEALAEQAEQEPVAWARTSESGEVLDCISHTYKVTQPCTVDYDEPLYAAAIRARGDK